MSLTRRDYILRMIEQLGDALARIASHRETGALEEAGRAWWETADAIFGPVLGMVERLDTPSAMQLLGGADKVYAYAALLEERSAIQDGRGNPRAARVDERRALELYLELAMAGDIEDHSRAAIERLRCKLDTGRLAANYQAALRALSH